MFGALIRCLQLLGIDFALESTGSVADIFNFVAIFKGPSRLWGIAEVLVGGTVLVLCASYRCKSDKGENRSFHLERMDEVFRGCGYSGAIVICYFECEGLSMEELCGIHSLEWSLELFIIL